MSGPYPRSWDVGVRDATCGADEAICRVSDAVVSDLDWDPIEEIVNPLLDTLVDAGYVEQWGHSGTGCFWGITDSGHDRLRALGRDDDSN